MARSKPLERNKVWSYQPTGLGAMPKDVLGQGDRQDRQGVRGESKPCGMARILRTQNCGTRYRCLAVPITEEFLGEAFGREGTGGWEGVVHVGGVELD